MYLGNFQDEYAARDEGLIRHWDVCALWLRILMALGQLQTRLYSVQQLRTDLSAGGRADLTSDLLELFDRIMGFCIHPEINIDLETLVWRVYVVDPRQYGHFLGLSPKSPKTRRDPLSCIQERSTQAYCQQNRNFPIGEVFGKLLGPIGQVSEGLWASRSPNVIQEGLAQIFFGGLLRICNYPGIVIDLEQALPDKYWWLRECPKTSWNWEGPHNRVATAVT